MTREDDLGDLERTIGEQETGRLDVALGRVVPGLSRRQAQRLIDEGRVFVNGRRAPKGRRVVAGEVVRLPASVLALDEAVADAGVELRVLAESTSWLALDKPAKQPTQPLRPGELGTLVGGLLARYPEVRGIGYGPREPGILHRLDTDTSGIVLVARTTAAFEVMRGMLASGEIEKTYRALVGGRCTAPRDVRLALRRDPRDARRVVPDPSTPDDEDVTPLTRILAATGLGEFALVTVTASPAKRHQVRAHLAALGHPIVGDTLYGGPALEGVDRHMLHASQVVFRCPDTGQRRAVDAPLPLDFAAAVARLERHA